VDKPYDVVIVGGGHNGLTAAAYLSRAGRSVCVVERRSVLGGACVTEELLPGARFSSCAYIVSSLCPEVIEGLELKRFGLELYSTEAMNFIMGPEHDHLFLWRDVDRTIREIEATSTHDAANFVEFGTRLRMFGDIIRPFVLSSPPALSDVVANFERAGRIDLFHEFASLSIGDLLDNYFDSETLKGCLMFSALVSTIAGPDSPGSAYEFSHHSWGEFEGHFGRFGYAVGGMGAIADALAASARAAGAEILVDAGVRRILSRSGEVVGVELDDGAVLHSSVVISNADPRTTLQTLVDQTELPRDTRRHVERIDMRGSMGRVHFLVDRLPEYDGMPSGLGPQHAAFTLLGVGRREFERARAAQLDERIASSYPIELLIPSVSDPSLAPPGLHTVTTGAQQLPFHLASGDWDVRREEFVDSIVRSIESFAPGFESSIRGTVSITPLDLQRTYGLPEGNIFHGAMSMNQLFASRQVAGATGYGTPIRGLFLCGAGMHPGGAVMGAAGHNVAMSLIAGEALGGPVGRRPRTEGRLKSLVMNDTRFDRVRYRVARNRLARPLVSALTRRR
jgi:phytoene dehydrogenase-like protein